MDTTIRNLDPDVYRKLKAKAALEGKSIGEAVNEAIRRYVRLPGGGPRDRSLAEIIPQDFGSGSERLSDEIDRVVYDR